MRTYKVTGMTCGGCEKSVSRAIKKQLGEDTRVDANAKAGEVRVEGSADPQMVVLSLIHI